MLNKKLSELSTGGSKIERPKLEAGTYPAIIDLLVDLGVQSVERFEEKGVFDERRRIWVGVCFPTETYTIEVDDEEVEYCQVVGKEENLTSGEKANLTKYFNAVCSGDDSIRDMLAKPCTVTVGITSGGKPKIAALSSPMKGTAIKMPKDREPVLVEEGDWDNVDDLNIPDFLKEKIKNRVGGE